MSESEARAIVDGLSYSEMLLLRDLLRQIHAEREAPAKEKAS